LYGFLAVGGVLACDSPADASGTASVGRPLIAFAGKGERVRVVMAPSNALLVEFVGVFVLDSYDRGEGADKGERGENIMCVSKISGCEACKSIAAFYRGFSLRALVL